MQDENHWIKNFNQYMYFSESTFIHWDRSSGGDHFFKVKSSLLGIWTRKETRWVDTRNGIVVASQGTTPQHLFIYISGDDAPAKDRTRTCGSKNQKSCSINSNRTLIGFKLPGPWGGERVVLLKQGKNQGRWRENGVLKQFSTKTLLYISLLPLLYERRFGTRIDGLHVWRYRTVHTTNVAKKGPVTTIGSLHLF